MAPLYCVKVCVSCEHSKRFFYSATIMCTVPKCMCRGNELIAHVRLHCVLPPLSAGAAITYRCFRPLLRGAASSQRCIR